jgi:uncharacterized membrane protein
MSRYNKHKVIMSYIELVYLHLATILPAFIIGTYLLLKKKGTTAHRLLGKLYMLLMLSTAMITLLMPAELGPRLLGHFGFIHLFSFLVLYSVPSAYFAIKKGDLKRHRGNMIGLYVGGLLIAGSFALLPNRLLHEWILKIISLF